VEEEEEEFHNLNEEEEATICKLYESVLCERVAVHLETSQGLAPGQEVRTDLWGDRSWYKQVWEK
jgi:hypothetical protein